MDSPLEQAGFELLVPRDTCSDAGRFCWSVLAPDQWILCRTGGPTIAHEPKSQARAARGRLLPRCGFLWWCSLLPGSRLCSRRIERVLDGLACAEPYCLAGCDLDGLSRLWIPPLACRSRRHIERAEARDTDRLARHEGIEDGVYHGLTAWPTAAWFSSVA